MSNEPAAEAAKDLGGTVMCAKCRRTMFLSSTVPDNIGMKQVRVCSPAFAVGCARMGREQLIARNPR